MVVDRDPEMPVHGMVAARRHHGKARHDPWRDAPVIMFVLGIAAGADIKPALAFGDLEDRHLVLLVILVSGGALEQRIGLQVAAMQP